jgi:hypothetical protein
MTRLWRVRIVKVQHSTTKSSVGKAGRKADAGRRRFLPNALNHVPGRSELRAITHSLGRASNDVACLPFGDTLPTTCEILCGLRRTQR